MIKRQPTGLRIIPAEHRRLSFLELWRMGYDTTDIAVAKDRDESAIYNFLSQRREIERREAQARSAFSG